MSQRKEGREEQAGKEAGKKEAHENAAIGEIIKN